MNKDDSTTSFLCHLVQLNSLFKMSTLMPQGGGIDGVKWVYM